MYTNVNLFCKMQVHYITDFVYCNDLDCLEYYSRDTLRLLNDHVNDYVDTSYWSRGDMIRVEMERYCTSSWSGNEGLFFWNGSELIYPFYNGNLNRIGSCEYEIDQQIQSEGFVPNCFQAIFDFNPKDTFEDYDGIRGNKTMFTDLCSFESDIYDNHIEYQVASDVADTLSITYFYYNGERYFVIFFGSLNNEINNYISNNRPYDFDAESALLEYNTDISLCSIQNIFDGSDDDHYMFIHPRFKDIDFNACSYESRLSRKIRNSKFKSNNSIGVKYNNKPKNNYKTEVAVHKCSSVTNKGIRCTRNAKDGYDYCGIHLELDEPMKCCAVTAKGIRCVRDAKDGYSYCGIHI